jgi:hypothetical protein
MCKMGWRWCDLYRVFLLLSFQFLIRFYWVFLFTQFFILYEDALFSSLQKTLFIIFLYFCITTA